MTLFTWECCKPRGRLCCCSICGGISLTLTIFFALALGFGLTDKLFFSIIKKELQLVPGSTTLDDWTDNNDTAVYQIFHIFDTQNPDQYISGAVPIVKEVGPFAYRKYDTKVNMRWNSDESVVTYNRDIFYVFVPEKSIGDPRDYRITVLNVPLIGLLIQQRTIENLLFRILGSALANFYLTLIGDQSLFIERTVHEIIWGYNDPLRQMLVLLGLSDDPFMRVEINASNPEIFYSVHTGKNDIDSVGSYIQWNNLTIIPSWNTEDARRVYGSESKRFSPRLRKDDILDLFIESLNSHIQIAFEKQTEIHGIPVYNFKNVYTMFSNMSEYPPNVGYNAYNFKHGLINETSNMELDLPVFISKPHCLDCDPEYFKNVSGYHPDREKHDAFSSIEPFTGIIMAGAVRGQANIRLERNAFSSQLARVRDVTIYPWFYYSLEGVISEHDADDFKHNIQLPRLILKISVIMLLCLSGIITLCIVGAQLRSYCIRRRAETGAKKSYEPVNGNARDYESTDGSAESVEINHCNFALLNNKDNYKDYQTIRS